VITGVVLAAGSSTRMGRQKLLLDLGGLPVLQYALDAAADAPLDEIVVVLGGDAKEVAAAIRLPERARAVINPAFAEGQSTSLGEGLGAADAFSEAAVMLLGDQPDIRADALTAVVEAFRREPASVVQAAYGGRPAHPTLLARPIWAKLIRGTVDEGARNWIRRHPGARRLVEVGGEPPDDIDTPEDYARVRARFQLP
jgi:molybdenum cofactor cytidylyltransferase